MAPTPTGQPTVPERDVESRILLIRGEKIILDTDLASFYGVSTKRLNEQVRRNRKRFPGDFMFRLTLAERREVVAKCDHLEKLKYTATLPLAFTEHGALMIASVLNTERAIEMSVFVIRAFAHLRRTVIVPPARITELRETIAQRRHFVRVKTAQVNAVKRHLRAAGLGHLARSLKTERNWDGLLSLLPAEGSLPVFVGQHRQLWQSANEEVTALEESLKRQAEAFAEPVRRLQTVPSVGPIVALTAIATFSDVSRFPSRHHAASYIGTVPATYQSGERDTLCAT